jgi:hypothetical protein
MEHKNLMNNLEEANEEAAQNKKEIEKLKVSIKCNGR